MNKRKAEHRGLHRKHPDGDVRISFRQNTHGRTGQGFWMKYYGEGRREARQISIHGNVTCSHSFLHRS